MDNKVETPEEDEYALIDLLLGKEIRAFTVSGRSLHGKILKRNKNGILVSEAQTNKQAFLNLDHVVAITTEITK